MTRCGAYFTCILRLFIPTEDIMHPYLNRDDSSQMPTSGDCPHLTDINTMRRQLYSLLFLMRKK